jgi:hypothetical protein
MCAHACVFFCRLLRKFWLGLNGPACFMRPSSTRLNGRAVHQFAIAAVALMLLAGCKTTEEAQKFVATKWVGKQADEFFIQNGPPFSVFDLDGGGKLYSWRGGEGTAYQANPTAPRPAAGGFSDGRRTTTSTTSVSGNTTVTRTTTTSSSVSFNPAALLAPQPTHRAIPLYCEAAIATDPSGRIINVRITNDTRGQMNFSRCAETFGTE